MKKKALVVIDMQNDFIDGSLGSPEAQAIVPNVVKKIEEFDGSIICLTMDTHNDEDYMTSQEGTNLPIKHCIKYTNGQKIQKDVFYAATDRMIFDNIELRVFNKGAFGSVELGKFLAGTDVDEIVFVGVCTDICVISNVLLVKAFLPEAEITVDAACCAGVTRDSHNNALAAMETCQVNIENWI